MSAGESRIQWCLCFSNVSQGSTSSGWSWPTHHEDPRQVGEEGDDGAGGMLEVGMDGSRRYSHLPPAKVELSVDEEILNILF